MIEITAVSKCFQDIKALDQVTATIGESQVFGLIGTNGAGKSTLMRILCGIYKPDTGSVKIDGEEIFENTTMKSKIFYISDEQYFYNNGTPEEMLRYYKNFYTDFDTERFYHLLNVLDLDKNRKINTFSKGMKKQLSVLYGVCSGTKYLLCDETFDGLDPVMRQTVKSLFINEMEQNGLTPIIASHNLRELEDICDHVGLLHKGGILLNEELENMKLGIHKLQCVFRTESDYKILSSQLNVIKYDNRGSLYTITLRENREKINAFMKEINPVFYEILPLSLEEIFISETEAKGYDFKNLIV